MDIIPRTLRYGCYTKVSELWMLYQGLRGMDVKLRVPRYGCYTNGSEVWMLYQSLCGMDVIPRAPRYLKPGLSLLVLYTLL